MDYYELIIIIILFIIIIGHASPLTGSWFLNQGSTGAPAVKVLSPNHWTAREFPQTY